MDFSRLDDKRVFVTGAADGIGAAVARVFKAGGARVFLCDIAEDRLRETAASLDSPCLPCDVTNPTSLARVVEKAWRELGGIDLVCANAGVVLQGPILEASREDLDWIFGVNVWGCLDTCRPFVRLLRENKKTGHILMTGSEASLSYPSLIHDLQLTSYLMSKHSVLALADGLRADLRGEGIGVSVLCPGPVATALSQNSSGLRPAQPGGGAKSGRGSATTSAAGASNPTANLRPDLQQQIAALSHTPDQIAATALAGLRRGLFVIPTHPHIEADVAKRMGEIDLGLRALDSGIQEISG